MSKEFKKLIKKLQGDPKAIGQFLANPVNFLKNFKITSEERKALLTRDVTALNDLGLTKSQAVGALSGGHSRRCTES